MHAKLRLILLQSLRDSGIYLQSEGALFTTARIAFPAATQADLEHALRSLDVEGYIVAVPAPITGDRRWKLTMTGDAALKELHV